jgi:hypothetical protein
MVRRPAGKRNVQPVAAIGLTAPAFRGCPADAAIPHPADLDARIVDIDPVIGTVGAAIR